MPSKVPHQAEDNIHAYSSIGIDCKKIKNKQSVEISIDLSSYYMAYDLYKKSETPMLRELHRKTYIDLRANLLDKFTNLTAGNMEDVFDMAMKGRNVVEMSRLKRSPAYEAMDDSFVEILKNAVDETLLKRNENINDDINVPLKAVVRVNIDDSDPNNLTISCLHRGSRGFPDEFLNQVNTPENRQQYIKTKNINVDKRITSEEIPLVLGGRGEGNRMLIKKIDQRTFVAADSKHAKEIKKASVSNIMFLNLRDASENVLGALISVTTSKKPIEFSNNYLGTTRVDERINQISTHFKHEYRMKKEGTQSPNTVTYNMDSDVESPKSDKKLGLSFDIDDNDNDDFQGSSPLPSPR